MGWVIEPREERQEEEDVDEEEADIRGLPAMGP